MSHWLANFLLATDFLDAISKGIFDQKKKKNVLFVGNVYISYIPANGTAISVKQYIHFSRCRG